ncbi:hypothetical protein [Paenarthrobacter nitroguajacolicus]|uniref:hypothetical protein n=1 Tax=Paenarthrobacter nitroguajacolicus TaxID=211146 RepID=UPI00248B0B9C|nr:hypothetical protein [Paenarthrobacter nitroguajacolicus]MDI2035927.1 hypothetical protein [Paenarthrobacter nitroguajacolicus]
MTLADVVLAISAVVLLMSSVAMYLSRGRRIHGSWIYGSFFGSLTAIFLVEPIYYAVDAAIGGTNYLALVQRAFLTATLMSMHIGIWRAMAPSQLGRQVIFAWVIAATSFGGQVVLFIQAAPSISSSGMRQYESNPLVAVYSLLMLAHLATVAFSAMRLSVRYSRRLKSLRRRRSLTFVAIGSGFALTVALIHATMTLTDLVGSPPEFLGTLERIFTASSAFVFALAIGIPTFPRWIDSARRGFTARRVLWGLCPLWGKLQPEIDQYVIWPYRGRLMEMMSRDPAMRIHRRIVEMRDCFESDATMEGRLSQAELAKIRTMEVNAHA